MTRRTPLALASVLLASLALPASAFELTIIHTNDVHDRFEPITSSGSTCSAEQLAEPGECFGGIARLASAIAERRAASENPLVLDAGDWFQGTLFFVQYGGEVAAEMINTIGYDAVAVGNHEFDKGPAELDAFVNGLDVPLLSSNIDVSAEPALEDGLILPSTVVEVGGERIGVVGVVAEDTPELAMTGEVAFEAPIEAVRREVERLSGEGIDKIVVLSHIGYVADQRLAEAVDGIDVIVGGHSHTLLANDVEGAVGPYPTMVTGPGGTDVPIVQAAAYTQYLGELTVTFDENGVVTAASGDPILLESTLPEDETVKARVAELSGGLEEIRNKVIGQTSGPIDGTRESCRSGECEMGNFVADAMLEHTAGQGTQLVIINGGGLRASIDEGEITQGEVLTVLPFLNTLSTFEVSGQAILAALENGVGAVEEGAGRFPQVAGLEYDWSRTAEPGSRIRAVRVMQGDDWVPIDPQATYLVASNNFMRNGGDGYESFVDAQNVYDFGPTIDTVVADYLAAQGGAYEPYLDGRINEVD
ncbi:bifunctional metallophosphatase/5'-nucleotidase [Aureimonas mangrovi]|uniref:bifunctional metallophosphatase/5'-nucleotidase n=1 Tax=Aureimonas mangrovi TaxID=2758041 RepID=UPI00163D8981|nr:5'-nucleotidase C-terminal domain-containing protein [Aureimonas mangrovi]